MTKTIFSCQNPWLLRGGLLAAGLTAALLILRLPIPTAGEQPESAAAPAGENHDAIIELSDQQIQAAGISTQIAAPAQLQQIITLPGEIKLNEDKTAHVVPRLAGVVADISVSLGSQVKKGQLLAVIASIALAEQRSELFAAQKRLTLAQAGFARATELWDAGILAKKDYLQAQLSAQEAEIALHNAQQKLLALGSIATLQTSGEAINRYEIRAPFDGMVVEKHIALGEAVKEDASIFTLSDLSTVAAEINVPAQDINAVQIGQTVTISTSGFNTTASGQISYIGALMGAQTRTAKTRILVANPQMRWRPGLFISAEIITGSTAAAVTVQADALQTIDGQTVVFVRVPGGFSAQPVSTGQTDGRRVEIISGLQPGSEYAAQGSFIIKSEHGKHAAEHSH